MPIPSTCLRCGIALHSTDSPGMCPECGLLANAATQSGATAESAAGASQTVSFHPVSLATVTATAAVLDAGPRLEYFGDYQLIDKIAQGGMGVVWKARQSSLKRDVALKLIRAGSFAGSDEVLRFLREAQAAASLFHPNIVAIHEAGEHQGQHYFSMDLVVGPDLGAVLKTGPLSSHVAARHARTVADAIQYAHQRGILHRDLKPQNILVDSEGLLRITDFGLAKVMTEDSQLTHDGTVMGSPSYMPPEQAVGRNGEITPASDVYSIGAILYEMLTGRPPFRAASLVATLRQVVEDTPKAPRSLKRDIPVDLETICLKCLEKLSSARYATARDLSDDLARFLKGEPIRARPASLVRKAVSWGRMHLGTLATVAAVTIAILAFTVFDQFEENSFLQAQQNNHKLAHVRGPMNDSLETWARHGFFIIIPGVACLVWIFTRMRGVTFNNILSRPLIKRTRHPLEPAARIAGMSSGLVLVLYAFTFYVRFYRTLEWEGIYNAWLIVYLVIPLTTGVMTLADMARDYRLTHFGSVPGDGDRQ